MLAQENAALISGPTTPSTSHSYSTRIRSNESIKPPARLRQSPETPLQPRKIRPNAPLQQKVAVATPTTTKAPPLPADTPEFPPPHVTLHPDDSTSKVFIAIGRSFLSVDNRAMTIKDLAEMTLKYGLMCQNVSAAGQAITTYIRNHMQRCDTEQDHPLLSRHVLSGTPSDDDLAPALHSRSGGAHCAVSPGDTRSTNFRRGTLVWFLSRAAGAPCPFARAGIRLSEYTEDGRVGATANGPRDRKRERDRRRRAQASAQLCGQKRKRLSRGCKADAGADTEEEPDPDPRPPKVKLTLRLRPSLVHSSSSSNSPSVAPSISASPAPAPATASPSASRETSESPDEDYVVSSSDESETGEESEDDMSVDDDTSSDSGSEASSDAGLYANPSDSAFFRMPSPSSFALRHSRSPSVASPPPDSDVDLAHIDEDDDDMFTWSADEDESEPKEPHKEPIDLTIVKEEVDEDAISSMLAAWDTRDLAQSSAAVIEAVAAAAAKASEQEAAAAALVPKAEEVYIKREEIDTWDFADFGAPPVAAAAAEEEEEEQPEEWEESVVFSPVDELGAMRWGSTSTSSWAPHTPAESGRRFSESFAIASSSAPPPVVKHRRMSELLWQDAEILGLDSITPKELEEGDWAPTTPATATGPTWPGARRSAFAVRQPVMPAHSTNVFPPTPITATFGSPPPSTPSPAELAVPASAPSPSAISDVSQDEPGPSTPPPPAHATLPAVWSASPAEGSAPFNFGFGNRHFAAEPEPGSARVSVPVKTRPASPMPLSDHDMDVDMGSDHDHDEVARSAELLKLVPPLPPPSALVEDEDPLSPAEEAVFAQLCAVPDFDVPSSTSSSHFDRPSHRVSEVEVLGELDENEAEETADVGEVERPLALRRSRRVAAAQKEAEKKAKAVARGKRGAKKRA
ncbi:hypothetical protein PENSPDRAFT_753172 [Peniophora sp. CONT]|nr:hypothetical protein PENSPDRAFT_753172 [Peniophora sp. CONT]